MKPTITDVLDDLSGRLGNDIAPQLSGFHAGNAAMIGAMLKMLAEHWNSAAANLLEENNALRAIFSHAAAHLQDQSLQPLANSVDDDIHIDALEKTNARLRQALIELHIQVEQQGDSARLLHQMIWDELRASVKRRSISSANF